MGRILVAVVAIGVAFYMYGQAADYPRAARRLPQLLSVILILLATLAVVREVVRLRRARLADGTAAGPLVTLPEPGKVLIGVAFVALIFVYAWAIPVAGYLVATPLMLALPLIALRPVGWRGIGITIVAVTGVIWLIFIWFLNLPVPLYPGA